MHDQRQPRSVLITGGTRGIGLAVAKAFARSHAHVIISGRNPAPAALAELQALGTQAHFVAMDIADESQVLAAFEQIQALTGGVDILVNNAGISKDFLLMRSKVSDWQEVIQVNLIGTLACSRAAIKGMVKKQWGRIINISSIIGLIGNPGQSVYATTKAGLIGMTKSLAKELGSRNITVNAIAPGFISTEMTAKLSDSVIDNYLKNIPLGRLGTPEDVAPLVAFLATDAAGYITGQVISINGGMA